MDGDLLSLAQVRQLLGGRFNRVCGGGACVPLDVNGRTMYFRPFVEQGLRKDLARYPAVTKGHRRPATPAADAYREFWTEAAAEVLLGRQAFTKAVRNRSLRPAVVRAGVRMFRRSDVRAHLPRQLSPAVQREYLALRRAMRAAGLGA
jgi:hypothetical protein